MTRPEPRVLLAFIAVVVFLGVNFVAVRITIRELPPFWSGYLRFAIAALLLFAIVVVRRLPFPRGRGLIGALLFGSLAFGVSFALLSWALVYVAAGLASVVFSTIPLVTLAIATAIGQESFRWRGVMGALIALASTALTFQEQLLLNVPFLPLIAVFIAVPAVSLAAIVVRGFPRSHPISTNAAAMSAGAALLLVISTVAGERQSLPTLVPTWIAVGWLVLSTSVAMILLVWILSRWTASATVYANVLQPFVTVAVAAWLTSEPLTPALAGGALLVLTGVYFGAIALQPRAQT